MIWPDRTFPALGTFATLQGWGAKTAEPSPPPWNCPLDARDISGHNTGTPCLSAPMSLRTERIVSANILAGLSWLYASRGDSHVPEVPDVLAAGSPQRCLRGQDVAGSRTGLAGGAGDRAGGGAVGAGAGQRAGADSADGLERLERLRLQRQRATGGADRAGHAQRRDAGSRLSVRQHR